LLHDKASAIQSRRWAQAYCAERPDCDRIYSQGAHITSGWSGCSNESRPTWRSASTTSQTANVC